MEITIEIKKLMEKADKAIEIAEELFANEHPSDAVSKTYYSMFYAAQALLKSKGIEVIKHSAVKSSLGYYFVKIGRLDPKYHSTTYFLRSFFKSYQLFVFYIVICHMKNI